MKQQPRKARWVVAQSKEFFSILRSVIFSFRSLQKMHWHGDRRPILLVHGYMNFGSVWLHHGKYLQKKGLGPVYALNLGLPFHSIEHYASKVDAFVQRILEETGQEEIDLVGHSMGGLVCSQYATTLAQRGTVGKLITLGSPLQGTWMANLALGTCGRQMRFQSNFTKDLGRKIHQTEDTQFYHIATKCDQLVVPYQSALMGSASRQYLLDDVGHVGLLYSEKVAKKMCEWLA